jgi:hypothetical protein
MEVEIGWEGSGRKRWSVRRVGMEVEVEMRV